ncbi:MAG: hypothetical protein R2819_08550 [Allomuricauda sp.]
MKNKKVYPNKWQTVPFSFDLFGRWAETGMPIKELILKNEAATALKVSEMQLNIVWFSAVDAEGNEHHIANFPGQNSVTFRGISSGHFLRSRSVVSLPEGNYTALRFYLANNGNRFTYRDGVEESANDFDRLEFTIENGLHIEGNEAPEVKLWFDFAPFQWNRRLKPLMDVFTNKNPKPRLANSFGN